MIDFRSGLWVNDKLSFCLWEEERPPSEGEEGMAYFYNAQKKKWLYDEAGTDVENDRQLADCRLTSWA